MMSWLGWTGFAGLGITGLAVLAIVGGPIIPSLARVTEGLVTPVVSAIGQGAASLIKFEFDGGVDVLQSGQRILFVITCCACTWAASHHHTMTQIHHDYTLFKKHYTATTVVPTSKHRR